MERRLSKAYARQGTIGTYNSRRKKNYDDTESDDELQPSESSHSIDISYVDTYGQLYTIKPNEKMKSYANMFRDLIKQ